MEFYPRYPPQVHTEPQPASTFTIETLWEVLGLSSFEGLDIECVRRLRSQVGSRDLSQIDSLLDASRLRSWLPTSHSRGLLIQGDSSQRAQVSALSHFCVALHCHLSEVRPDIILLVFVCGRHTERTEKGARAEAIIRSFVSQLITKSPQARQAALAVSDAALQLLRHSNPLDWFCSFFWHVASSLPPETMVFCIIDGIGFYERDATWVGMRNLLSTLLAPQETHTGVSVVKVLATSAWATRAVKHLFRGHHILQTRSSAERLDVGGVMRKLERQLREFFGEGD